MDTFTELRQLADDLAELGDNATATLVRQAIDRFSASLSGNASRCTALAERNVDIAITYSAVKGYLPICLAGRAQRALWGTLREGAETRVSPSGLAS